MNKILLLEFNYFLRRNVYQTRAKGLINSECTHAENKIRRIK